MKLKTAAVQFAPKFGEKKANLLRLGALVHEAAEHNAQLIVLPELATTGYSFMSAKEAAPYSEVLTDFSEGTSMGMMSSFARQYGCFIAWGLVERDVGARMLYNTQVLVGPEGQYEHYRKINRWGNDFLWSAEGRANPSILRGEFVDPLTKDRVTKKLGLLICRDVRDKKDDSWKSFYEKGDADIICFSANWGDGGFPAVSWMDFVKDNQATLIVSNRYGKELPNNFGEGGVCIIEPNGKVHCEGLRWNEDCIVYAEI